MCIMVCFVIIHALRAVSPHVHILFLYAIPPPRPACALLPPVFEHLRQFGFFVGLQMWLMKCARKEALAMAGAYASSLVT